MNGQQLYALWVQANDEENVGVDDFDQLCESDQRCWHRLAELVDSMEVA
jgi:hypothetical protein